MGIYEELVARGLIAQVTNEEEIREMVNNGKATFYIGFDCTADSLHVGHFVQMMVMAHMQRAGHRPIALLGGGTGMVGDPTGKTDMRKMMTVDTIQHHVDCFKKQMSKFVDFSDGKALMVDNGDWLRDSNYIDFLREVNTGRATVHFHPCRTGTNAASRLHPVHNTRFGHLEQYPGSARILPGTDTS